MIDNQEINNHSETNPATKSTIDSTILEQELATCQQEKADLELVIHDIKQKQAYLNADFDNFRRRALKDYEQVRTDAITKIVNPLLTIADDFDRALAASTGDQRDGFVLIRKEFDKLFTEFGITPMPVSGQFDPEKHEALIHVESTDHQSEDIVEVLQKGYLLNGTILRPAKVSVAV
jgi:molecular chaperone GrpE